MAKRIKLTTAETKDIFHYHLYCFTFDRLITYANRLFSPTEIEIIINKITITDHAWKKKGREAITKELILNIFRTEINNQRFFPTDYQGKRKVFLREGVPFDDKK